MSRRPPHTSRSSRPGRWEGKPKPDWVARALARAGALAQSDVEPAIRAGRVTLDGRRVQSPLTPLEPGATLKLDGRVVPLEAPTRVLLFHKPAETLTSTERQNRVPTVYELLLPQLPPELAGYTWHAVGRLDRDTTGLLLFTNDERLLAHVTSPDSRLPKRYVAEVFSVADDAKVEPLRRGMTLDDGPARPARVQVRGPHTVEVTLTEGRNHQVKRMLGAVGLPTRALHREAVGSLACDVPPGVYRLLSDDEVRDGLGFPPSP